MNAPRQFYVYLLANRKSGAIYTGMTNDLVRRVHEHKTHVAKGFTDRYGVDKLVWFEVHGTAENAITREKQIKDWRRAWKVRLIVQDNPEWDDLWSTISQ